MFETQICVVGRLVSGVDQRRFADGSVLASFRVVSTERRYDRATGGWTDGDRLFLDVTCRRRLAENTVASLVKGDAVVVTGRLYTREFEHDGRRRSTMTLEAQSVAADLSRCTAVLARTGPPASASPEPEADADGHRAPPPAVSTDLTDGGTGGSRLVGALPGGED